MHEFEGDFTLLDAQLPQPADGIHAFERGKWPAPGTLSWANPVFERILKVGTDPDTTTFMEPNKPGKRFNLFARVSAHLPFSADWLFKPLAPYFERDLPAVDYATF